MQIEAAAFGHGHLFLGDQHDRNERRTWAVVALTTTMMVAEIVGGTVYGSMALTADGWHMSTHAAALAIAALAYRFARQHSQDQRFTFGTGKVGDLAAFSSALILGLIAILIAYESLLRLANPISIGFDQSIAIAVIGLAVNLASAWLLAGAGGHSHSHSHHHDDHDDHHHHSGHAEDHNLRAAYLHVLADALTSVLAIVALLAGRFYAWLWLDPVIGVVGAVVIARWSWGLLRQSGAILLDTVPNPELRKSIRAKLETSGDKVTDLHLWRVGPGHSAVIVSLVSNNPQRPAVYKALLGGLPGLSHVTVEVQPAL